MLLSRCSCCTALHYCSMLHCFSPLWSATVAAVCCTALLQYADVAVAAVAAVVALHCLAAVCCTAFPHCCGVSPALPSLLALRHPAVAQKARRSHDNDASIPKLWFYEEILLSILYGILNRAVFFHYHFVVVLEGFCWHLWFWLVYSLQYLQPSYFGWELPGRPLSILGSAFEPIQNWMQSRQAAAAFACFTYDLHMIIWAARWLQLSKLQLFFKFDSSRNVSGLEIAVTQLVAFFCLVFCSRIIAASKHFLRDFVGILPGRVREFCPDFIAFFLSPDHLKLWSWHKLMEMVWE